LFPTYNDEALQGSGKGQSIIAEGRSDAEKLLTPRALDASRSLRMFDAPASPVPVSALLAGACQAPYLLRHGLWPVNPLSDPRLVAFCHRLPLERRRGREVMRQYLQTHLGDDVFLRDYVKETFAQVLPNLVSRHVETIASQLRDCALADLGLVDRNAVLELLNKVATTKADASMAPLASFLWLERFARQIS
jgi:asparagine synthase (glutamine-hydrolysing)